MINPDTIKPGNRVICISEAKYWCQAYIGEKATIADPPTRDREYRWF